MTLLLSALQKLRNSKLEKEIQGRLKSFISLKHGSAKAWFSELCFCILAANAKSRTSWNIQKELGFRGFMALSQDDLAAVILKNKHRFHNTKAKYIIENRQHQDIKNKLKPIIGGQGIGSARAWLVANIKGFGYKEASHFLRNVGYFELAILDRHINNVMLEHGIIKEIPPLSPKNYLEIEKKFLKLSEQTGMQPGELDMYMWYMEAGEVLK